MYLSVQCSMYTCVQWLKYKFGGPSTHKTDAALYEHGGAPFNFWRGLYSGVNFAWGKANAPAGVGVVRLVYRPAMGVKGYV